MSINTHNDATDRVVQWLVNAEKYSTDYCNLAQFKWRKNYGVYKELRFYESSSVYYFEIDTEINKNILFIPDITVFSKGVPIYFFEILNTHAVEENKINKIARFFDRENWSPPEVYEIGADYILSINEMPQEIEAQRIL